MTDSLARHDPRSGPQPTAAAVILAGGSGSRVGAAMNKVYLPLAGRPAIAWCVSRAWATPEVGRVVLVVRPEDRELAGRALAAAPSGHLVDLVLGGASRHTSEEAALQHLAAQITQGAIDVVAIHDGARPLADPALWSRCIATARTVGGAVPGVPAADVLLRSGSHHVGARPATQLICRVQTPQAFRARELLEAFRHARVAGFEGTDTASCVEAFSTLRVQIVPTSGMNLKVTYAEDIALVERLLDLEDAAAT